MTVPFLQARSIKLKVAAQFPANLFGRNGVTVNKSNGTYFVDIDYSKYVPVSVIPPGDVPNLYVLMWNAATGIYELAPIILVNQVGALGNTVIVQTTPYTVQLNDGAVIVKLITPAPTTINLPAAASHNGPVHISDGALNAGTNNITIKPNGTETIVGLSQWVLGADGAGITLYPVSGVGWYV